MSRPRCLMKTSNKVYTNNKLQPVSFRYRSFIYYLLFLIFLSYATFFRHNILTISYIFGIGHDPLQYVWFLKWWPYALLHIHNPFITTLQWYPTGYNLALTTSIPALSLIFFPITYLLGALPTFNIITIIAPAISALSCAALLYSITKRTIPSFIGGYLYGFSPYELGQLQGHLHLDFIVIPPLLLFFVSLFWKRTLSSSKFLILFTLSLLLQFGISLEIFATLTYCGAFAIALWYVFDTGNRARIAALFKLLTISYAITGIACSIYIYFFVFGLQHAPSGFPYATNSMQANLLSYFIPNPTIWYNNILGFNTTITTTSDENSVYIGIPLMLLLFYYFFSFKVQRIDIVALLTLFVTAILALGSKIYFSNIYIAPGLWSLVRHLPALRYALPNRLSLYLCLCISFIITRLLSALLENGRILNFTIVAMVSVASIYPNFLDSSSVFNSVIRYNIPTDKRTAENILPKGSNVLFIPFKTSTYPMFFQSERDMTFNIIGGYLGQPVSAGLWPAVRTLINGYPLVDPKLQLFSYLSDHDAKRVVILKSSKNYNKWVTIFESFGWISIKFSSGIAFVVPRNLLNEDLHLCTNSSQCNSDYESSMARVLLNGVSCLAHRNKSTSTILGAVVNGCIKRDNIFLIGDDSFSINSLHNDVNNWVLFANKESSIVATNGWHNELDDILQRFCKGDVECLYPYPEPYRGSHVGGSNVLLMSIDNSRTNHE